MRSWAKTYILSGSKLSLETNDIKQATHIAGITVSHNNDVAVKVSLRAVNSGFSWEHYLAKGIGGEELLPAENVNDDRLIISIESGDASTVPDTSLKEVIIRVRYLKVEG